jgi:hypothetical protein
MAGFVFSLSLWMNTGNVKEIGHDYTFSILTYSISNSDLRFSQQ